MNILAIDQGTSATKALLVGPGQEVLGTGEVPVSVRAVGADGVEADPEELYRSVIGAGSRALAAAGAPADAVALANQGETVLAWDRRTGEPLTPAIVWQDRRSAAVCERVAGSAARLARLTGLPLDPYFAAPKMTWLRENLTGEGVVTTTDTWLLARLGGGYVTDAATASRTLLLDLDAASWSPEACGIFGLDPAALPEVADCAAVTGETSAFGRALPVAGLAVDQQAALLAERCFAAGQAKCTYGTGAFLLATTGVTAVRSASGLSASIAWRLAGTPTYCLDGQVYTAGAAIRWLGEVGLLRDAGEIDEAGRSVQDSGGVTFLPSLAGLGAPHWLPAARGAFLGLGLATTRAHLIRAVAYATEAVRAGARLELGRLVTGVRSEADGHALATTCGTVHCRWLVNAAGLGGDVIDTMLGGGGFTIRPRRGELIVFDKLARPLLGSILLPVPTAATKGVLVAPTVYGNVLLGPTAEDIADRSDTGTTAAGLAALLEARQRIVPDLAGEEVTATYAGLRAATEHRDYQIRVDRGRRYACVAGIRSTGLSASLGIAEYVTDQLAGAGLPLAERGATVAGPPAMPYIGEAGTRPYQDAARIAADPEYGRIVCHCERVTRGEIRDALASTVPPADAGGLRRRTRAMNGRCQGFYCAATVSAMMGAAQRSASAGPAADPGPTARRALPKLGRLA